MSRTLVGGLRLVQAAITLLILAVALSWSMGCGGDDATVSSANPSSTKGSSASVTPTAATAGDELSDIAWAACRADLGAAGFAETSDGTWEQAIETLSNGVQVGGRTAEDIRLQVVEEASSSSTDIANGISRHVRVAFDLLLKKPEAAWEDRHIGMEFRLINGGWQRYGFTTDNRYGWEEYRTPMIDGCFWGG